MHIIADTHHCTCTPHTRGQLLLDELFKETIHPNILI